MIKIALVVKMVIVSYTRQYLKDESLEKKEETLDMSDWKLENVKVRQYIRNGTHFPQNSAITKVFLSLK